MKIILLIIIPTFLYSQTRYTVDCNSDLLWLSRQIALNQVGVIEETNRNDGEVVKYLESVGLNKGNPYCAAGQYYCFNKAAIYLNFNLSSIPIPQTGLANRIFDHGRISGSKTKYNVEVDDLIIWRKGRTIYGHVERVVSIQKAGWVKTIAFNVKDNPNQKNSSEGVFIKKRNIFHPLGRLSIRGLLGFKKIKKDIK